nr:hypothetical protein [Nostoc sp. TCL26-01]
MCHLIEFNGVIARVGVKPAWHDKVKSDLPMIAAAFQQTCHHEVQVTLEKSTGANSPTTRREPPANSYGNNGNGNGSSTVKQPPPANYNNHKPPAPQPTTPPPASSKTESVSPNTGGTRTPPPTPNKPPLPEWETDEVAIAAQRLAQFFDGQIIRFGDDGEGLSEMGTSEWTDDADLEDE